MPLPLPSQPPMFSNSNEFTITQSNITQIHGSVHHNHGPSGWDRLQQEVAPGAFHDSGESLDPPKCHPGTRLKVTECIISWIYGNRNAQYSVAWLHGAAGAGKSAIAQRIAELCHQAKILLASYFASNRAHPRRMDANSIIPSVSYQIAITIPAARPLIEEEITRDPFIFTRSLETQMDALIIRPLQPFITTGFFADPTSSPRLVIIDGLDEISDRSAQVKVLEVITNALQRHHIPLIFLISSRPEHEISHAFSIPPLQKITGRLVLDETFYPDDDIRVFLNDSFSKIKISHPIGYALPSDWPKHDDIERLLRNASGQFIYASTVIHFVKSTRHRPEDQLDIVLGLQPVHGNSPFSDLDALYMKILQRQKNWEQIARIISILNVAQRFYYAGERVKWDLLPVIEKFLGLQPGDGTLCLADMASLMSWDPEGKRSIQLLHASFRDFLSDPNRSGNFMLDEKGMHTIMTCCCLQKLINSSESRTRDWGYGFEYAQLYYYYHLQKGRISEDLTGFLRTIPFEKVLGCLGMEHRSIPDRYLFCFFSLRYRLTYQLGSIGLEQSTFHSMRTQILDKPLQNELNMRSSWHSQLSFLLCLWMRDIESEFLRGCDGGLEGIMQLTDWHAVTEPKNFTIQAESTKLPFFLYATFRSRWLGVTDTFRDFFQDSSRSGRYALTAETYASASVNCLKYLFRSHLGPPINLHHTPRNLARRRNSPWHWKRYKKLICRLPTVYERYQDLIFAEFPRARQRLYSYDRKPILSECEYLKGYKSYGERRHIKPLRNRCVWVSGHEYKCENIQQQFERHQKYMEATRIGLIFLSKALPLSAPSKELVELLRADKSFNPRAVLFPKKLKECKAAIVAYLNRVLVQPKSEKSMSTNDTEMG